MASKICLVELMGSAGEKRRSIIEVSSFKELVQNLREMHGIAGDGPASRLPFYVVVNPIPPAALSAPSDDDKTRAGILSKGNFSQLVLSNSEEVVELRCLPLDATLEAPVREAATVDEEKATGPRKAAAAGGASSSRNTSGSSIATARPAPVGPINPSALAAALRGCTPSPRAPQPTPQPAPTATQSSTTTADRAQKEILPTRIESRTRAEPPASASVAPQPAVSQRGTDQPALASWSSREAAKPTSVPSRPTSAASSLSSKTPAPVASSSPLVAAPGRLPIDFDSPKPSRKKTVAGEADSSTDIGRQEETQSTVVPPQAQVNPTPAPTSTPAVNPREAELEAFRRRKEAAAASSAASSNQGVPTAAPSQSSVAAQDAYSFRKKNAEEEEEPEVIAPSQVAQAHTVEVSTSPPPSKKIVVAESFPSPPPDVQSGTFLRSGKSTSVSVDRPSDEAGDYGGQQALVGQRQGVSQPSSEGVVAEILPIPVTQVRSAQSIIDLRLWALSQLNDRIVARYGPRPFLSGSMRIRTQVKFAPYPGAAAEVGRELDVDDDEDFARIRAMTPVPQLEAVWRGELGAESSSSNLTASSIGSSSLADTGSASATGVSGSGTYQDTSASAGGPRKAANRRPVASRLDFDDARYTQGPPPTAPSASSSAAYYPSQNQNQNQSVLSSSYSDPHAAAYPSEPSRGNGNWQWSVHGGPQPQNARSSSLGTRQAPEPAMPPAGAFVAPLRHSAERDAPPSSQSDSMHFSNRSQDRSRTPDFRPNGAVTPHARGSDGLNVVKVENAENGAVAVVPFAVDRPPSLWSLRRQVSLQLTGSAEAALKLVTVFPASDHRLADRLSDKGFQLQSDSDVILFSDGLRQAHLVGGPVPFLEAYPPNC